MRGYSLISVLAWMLALSCGYIIRPDATSVDTEGSGTTTATTAGEDDDAEGEGDDGDGEPPETPVLELSLSQVKQFDFEWLPALGAKYYQLLESIEVGGPYVQVGEDMMGLATSLTVPLHLRLNASYKLRACNHAGCAESEVVDVERPLVEAIGYFKASNTDPEDNFGQSVALSGDGTILAVGAHQEDSSAIGIGGDQTDNLLSDAGAVYVFVRDGQNTWSQQAYVKASNSGPGDRFGFSVALSSDGGTLAVGAVKEASSAIGIGGNPADDSAPAAGAVYVFVRDGQNTWSQQAYVKASNPDPNDQFGVSVALSDDGDTLAVAALQEASSANGIGGDQLDNSFSEAGAVYVFVRDGQDTWSQQAYVKASNPEAYDIFGNSVALSSDGNTLAVGAMYEDSSAPGIGGNQADNSAPYAGAAYVFVRDGQNTWSQQAYVKASNPAANDKFGQSMALSGDGNTLAVGAHQKDTVYLFVRKGKETWLQQAYIKASTPDSGDLFGWNTALSGNGSTLAVGAIYEASSAMGLDGSQADNTMGEAGAVYVFLRDGHDTWSQRAYVKASNPGSLDEFGTIVALSDDGNTMAVSAIYEASSAMGIGGNQADDSAPNAGAVYIY